MNNFHNWPISKFRPELAQIVILTCSLWRPPGARSYADVPSMHLSSSCHGSELLTHALRVSAPLPSPAWMWRVPGRSPSSILRSPLPFTPSSLSGARSRRARPHSPLLASRAHGCPTLVALRAASLPQTRVVGPYRLLPSESPASHLCHSATAIAGRVELHSRQRSSTPKPSCLQLGIAPPWPPRAALEAPLPRPCWPPASSTNGAAAGRTVGHHGQVATSHPKPRRGHQRVRPDIAVLPRCFRKVSEASISRAGSSGDSPLLPAPKEEDRRLSPSLSLPMCVWQAGPTEQWVPHVNFSYGWFGYWIGCT
jgi:hypothetical protein